MVLAVCHKSYTGLTPQGGAEVLLHSLLKLLVAQGHDVSAVCFGKKPTSLIVDGVKVYRRRSESHFDDLARKADVVITHLGGTAAARKAARLSKAPLVQVIHNTSQYTVGFLGSGCDLAIYNSLWVHNFHALRREEKKGLSWVPPGVTRLGTISQEIIVRPLAERPPTKGGNPSGKITMVNLTPNKGPEIFYALAERNPDLEFQAVIGGYEQDQQDIRQMDNVSVHQHTRDVDQFYSQASVILMPSRYESYGLVAVEAMARGIPVIATDTPGLHECLAGGGTLVTEREDIDLWQEALGWALDRYGLLSGYASHRYEQLQAQTELDKKLFIESLEEVGTWGL